MNEQVSPSTLATDRSISPVMTTSVIGSAINAIGMTSRETNRQNRGLATPSIVAAPMTATRTSATRTMTSHDPRTEPRTFSRSRIATPSTQEAPGDADRERAVQADRGEDQGADGGPLPERADPQYR